MLRELVRPFLAAALAVLCGNTEGCRPVEPAVAVSDSAYASAQIACVEKSATVEESRKCRADLDKLLGIKDGGVDE